MAKEDSVARKNGKYLLLFVFCFLVAALQAKSPVYGQAKTFTVSLKNVTLKEVISYVEKNSQYVFFFKPEVINQSTQISVSLKNATVKQLLDKVSEQANIVYEMKERQIVLKEKKVSEQSVSQKKRLLQGLVKRTRKSDYWCQHSVKKYGNRGYYRSRWLISDTSNR